MKNILPILLLVTLCNICIGQNQPINSADSVLKELVKQNQILTQKTEELSKQLDTKTTLADYYDSRVSWLEVLVGILGALVGIVSIALPISIYFFQIRPAEKIIDEVKDVDAKVEEKLKKYLEDEELKRIDKALEDVVSNDEKISNNASLVLSFNQTFDFTEEQLFKVYMALKSDLDFNKKSILAMILATKETTFGDDFFKEALASNENFTPFLYHFVRYLAVTGIDKFHNEIIEYVLTGNNASKNKSQIQTNYITIGINMMMHSKQSFKSLINDKILNSGLDDKIREQVIRSLSPNAKTYNLEDDIQNSLLAQGLAK